LKKSSTDFCKSWRLDEVKRMLDACSSIRTCHDEITNRWAWRRREHPAGGPSGPEKRDGGARFRRKAGSAHRYRWPQLYSKWLGGIRKSITGSFKKARRARLVSFSSTPSIRRAQFGPDQMGHDAYQRILSQL